VDYSDLRAPTPTQASTSKGTGKAVSKCRFAEEEVLFLHLVFTLYGKDAPSAAGDIMAKIMNRNLEQLKLPLILLVAKTQLGIAGFAEWVEVVALRV
jgi:hypothetical protein